MKLSAKSQYGLKACYVLALNYPDQCVSASALEKEIFVSGKYLEKILRMLSAKGVVCAERGVLGGYRLAKPPAEITVGQIVRALETDMEIAECVSMPCQNCPSQNVWKRLYDGIQSVLESITLQSMLDDGNGKSHPACAERKTQTEE